MEVLPDYVGAQPLVVFCGMAGANSSRGRDHYYETPGNAFWDLLHESGLDGGRAEPLGPVDDHLLPSIGLGVTDLVRHRDAETRRVHDEVVELAERVRIWQPEWLACTSKTVAAAIARVEGHRPPGLGIAGWDLAGAPVYVLPGPSGANRRADYDGRPDRLSWWRDLAGLVGR